VVPADEARIVSDEAEACDFCNVATEDVDWLWREAVWVDKPSVALHNAHGIVRGSRIEGGTRFGDPFLEVSGGWSSMLTK
jgi:hypothetical protein